MASTTAMKNTLASAYAGKATHAAAFTSAPGATAGTEVSGGSYARKPITWSAPSAGVITGTVTFDIPASTTVVGLGYFDALTAGNYQDGFTITSQAFSTTGQLVVNLTATIN